MTKIISILLLSALSLASAATEAEMAAILAKAMPLLMGFDRNLSLQDRGVDDLCDPDTKDHTMCLPTKGPNCPAEAKTELGMNTEQQTEMLKEHNDYRRKLAKGEEEHVPNKAANMNKLTWDEDLAAVAQRWADQCSFDHDDKEAKITHGFLDVGQNIFQSMSSKSSDKCPIKAAVKAWYDEVSLYHGTGEDFTFDHSTGHFTQVAWAKTTKIGCGWSQFFDGEWYNTIVVCNYGVGGNVIGEPMFKHGDACSACEGSGGCEDSLCT